MYVVTRNDLHINYQLPQTCHATTEFAYHHPEEFKEWFENSSCIVVLAVADEQKLTEFAEKAAKKGLKFVKFHEPDIGNALTGVALVPNDRNKKICSNLPLAGIQKHVRMEERV